MKVVEGHVIRCLKALIGSHKIRVVRPAQRYFTDHRENWIAEPDVSILIVKMIREKEKRI
jgi:hypothetical protein